MIKFKKIIIRHFLSIEEETIEFNNGIFSLSGKNMSGKTTSVLALLQGLFNKNIKSGADTIDETYNKVTKKPYHIIIEFDKDNDSYVVDNNRVKNSITIYKNGENISKKGIKNQLKQIEDILGFNYNTFSAFYYLSTTTLTEIFNISSDQNLIYKFFDIDTIKMIEKGLKSLQREYKSDVAILIANIKSLERQINTLTNFKQIDKEALYVKKSILQESLLSLEESNDNKRLTLLKNEISKVDEALQKLKGKYQIEKAELSIIDKQIETFEKGKCPVCGSDVTGKSTDLYQQSVDIKDRIKDILKEKEKLDNKKNKMLGILNELEARVVIKRNELTREIQAIDSQLLVYEQEEENYKQLAHSIDNLEQEKITFVKQYKEKSSALAYITTALSVIKSNAITKEYLNNFIILLNNKIKTLSDYIGFDTEIIIQENKGKLKYKFLENGIEKTLNSLSAGEKTRVALVSLFSILETIQILSNNKFNILVMDELLGVLDSEGVEILKQLLLKYREDLCIFVVLHHDEIDKQFFDGIYYVRKENGISRINYKENKNV